MRNEGALYLLLLLSLGAAAAASPTVGGIPAPPAMEPEAGDVVLRRGNGMWSRFFARLNRRDQRFSHAGVVVRDDGVLKVVHAEANDAGADGEVRLEDFRTYTASASRFALLRLDDRAAAMRVAEAALSMHASALPFDLDFDLADPAAVYCSELVWRALATALRRDPLPEKPRVGGRRVVLIENFLLDMPDLHIVTP